MLYRYKTVYRYANCEIIEKKSRFIASVSPAETEEEAKSFIEKIKKEHYNANHHVFAYVIGENNEIQRYSDDKEPSGTAGIPVLEQLKSKNIKWSVVVVTRFFGGILLGTGGLVRAYSRAAGEGIKEAVPIEKVLYQQLSIETEYSKSGKIQYETLQNNHIIKDIVYTDKVEYKILAEYEKKENFIKHIIDIMGGKISVTEEILIYGAYINGNFETFDINT